MSQIDSDAYCRNMKIMVDTMIETCSNIEPRLLVDRELILQAYEDSRPERELSELESYQLLSDVSVGFISIHPDYDQLAARFLVKMLHVKHSIDDIDKFRDRILNNEVYNDETIFVMLQDEVREYIDYSRDYGYSIQAMKTLMRSYLYDETPQEMLMRVSIGIHGEFNEDCKRTYDMMSNREMTHATPTLFNSGTRSAHMSSCFLFPIEDDSIEGIFNSMKQIAVISKNCGGIGISVSNVRANGSRINRNGGISNGIIPMIGVINSIASYVDQGGRRKAAICVYLEPWHADFMQFLELKINHGDVNLRARELFYGVWMNDLFMERVRDDLVWSFFCPNSVPLYDYHGDEFRELYEKSEREGLYVSQMSARTIWTALLRSQIETGSPFMLYKDACNRKSNHRHLGTIRSSNLCTEIIQYSSDEETAVCTIGSLSLTSCVVGSQFDMDKLGRLTRQMVRNLDRIVDRNEYSTKSARLSAIRHRAIGVGVQGLANVFFRLRLPFTSNEAKSLNKRIFERIYFEALSESVELARIHGTYESYEGSPISQGLLQHDLWTEYAGLKESSDLDWKTLRENISKYGVRNSLLTSPMPTASTSQILGNVDCFEPIHANIYNRKTLSGDCMSINRELVSELIELGIWNDRMKDRIIRSEGSIQSIEEIPEWLREIYKTAWELKTSDLIDMSIDRGLYIDQSQSLTIFVPHHAKSDISKYLTTVHFYAWKRGAKTGMYYLRSQPGAMPTKVTLSVEDQVCSIDDPTCESCSG